MWFPHIIWGLLHILYFKQQLYIALKRGWQVEEAATSPATKTILHLESILQFIKALMSIFSHKPQYKDTQHIKLLVLFIDKKCISNKLMDLSKVTQLLSTRAKT